MRKKNALTLALILTAAATSACLSNDEKAARRACALDVAGDYTEVRAEGIATGTLAVANETDKNDVKLTFARGALYDGEQPFLDRLANDADKEALLASVVLGEGKNELREELAGGENISSDFGSSSELDVLASELPAVASVEGAEDPKLRYSLALGIENGSDELKGTLTVTFSEQRPNATDDTKELHTEVEAFPVVFKRPAILEAAQSDECKAIVDGE